MADESDDVSSALELFTDPACNIFGTFCFIVILLGFMSVIQSEVTPTDSPMPMVESPAESKVLQALEARLAETQSSERLRKLSELEALRVAASRRKSTATEAHIREDALMEELGRAPDLGAALRQMAPRLSEEIRELDQAIRDAQARSEVASSLPRDHAVGGDDVKTAAMILSGGRAYMVTKIPEVFVPMPFEDFVRLWDDTCVQVDLDHKPGALTATQRVTLRPEGSVDLRAGGWQGSARWRAWLAVLRQPMQQRHPVVVYLIVDPQSHAEFAAMRAELQSHGIFYNVEPQRPQFHLDWRVGDPRAQ